MPRDAAYVAVYDVSEDRERTRLAKVLEGFGLRVQYSAFEMRLTPATRQTLLRRLEDLKLSSGFVYLYRRAGGHDRAGAGKVPDDPLAEDRHAYVLAESATQGRQVKAGARAVRRKKPVSSKKPDPKPPPAWSNTVLPADFGDRAAHRADSRDRCVDEPIKSREAENALEKRQPE